MKWIYRFLRFQSQVVFSLLVWLVMGSAEAQITSNGLGTVVNRNGNVVNITGGM